MKPSPTPPDSAVRSDDGFFARGAEVTRLEAFVDAAFAFAISLMVISIDTIPVDAATLKTALKSVPAFGASFLLISTFWSGHADWSRRYGLDDRASRNLSLLLVFVVLVFVYPLRMVFSAFFSWVTDGAIPTTLELNTLDDVHLMFGVFAIGFGMMGVVLWALYLHAWRRRERLALDAVERGLTRLILWRWTLVPLFAVISLLCLLLPVVEGYAWVIPLPGLVFFGLHIAQVVMYRVQRRATARLLAGAP